MRNPTTHSIFFITLLSFLLTACENSSEDTPIATANQERSVPSFVDVTVESRLSNFQHDNGARGNVYFPELMGSGGGFVDYNGDQWLDILLVSGGLVDRNPSGSLPGLHLYQNNQDGTFSEVTEETGLSKIQAYGQGITAADFDNDGDEDVYFTTLHRNYLFRNDGGNFTDIAEESGVEGEPAWSSAALFFDADRDGDLDLYVANYVEWSPETDIFCSIQGMIVFNTRGATDLEEKYGQKVYCPPSEFQGLANHFYRNNGNGSFTNETEEAGFLLTPNRSLGAAEFDYNKDGWPDIVVTNDAEPDQLYKNNGDGTFVEIGQRSGIALGEFGNARAGMGIDTGVVDENGHETIFIGNFSSEMIGVYTYKGNDQFIDRASSSKIGQPSYLTLTFGLFLFDVEYDGDLDLLAANGHVWAIRPTLDGSTYRQKAQLYVNKNEGVFEEATLIPGGAFEQEMVARGASYGDYDRDGDLDILITENGGPAHLWRNDLNDANYLRVRLKGTPSNIEGLGSQIIAVVGNQRMHRRIRTGSSYLSQSEKVASFGLGNSTQVDSLIVHWPSGEVDILIDIQGNQEIEILESSPNFFILNEKSEEESF